MITSGLGRLTGKRVVITGASSGIGEATALLFAREGARVALLSRREAALEDVARRIEADGGSAVVLACDVSQEEQVASAFTAAEEVFGGLDTVVGVAGVELYDIGDDRVDRLELSVWQRTLDINLTGMFLTLKYGVQALLRNDGGAMVVTGSPTGLYGIALGEDAYSAAKAGCHGLARVVANEVARDGIRVNIVVPGLIDTPINARFKTNHPEDWQAVNALVPMRRAGLAEEVATMNLWLCTDEASYATGGYFTVDGGWTAI